ncbi:DMT family transporter [Sulfitobacter mediterraneus]|uniref:Peptide ABC transporter permease n=1 Tax=Sulfitobacter mediterraneus TaxID=83219 RepID=A0A061SLZ3_9RHOB|nr:DMT family transporter [Sulfitobacter mediterraneus]KAJ02701.1 peptide ABC transporter permease [Sulfitobacter mediterraneus]MBM1310887.1 DMT family transporter [Sulfitobacter mediterraneus]MBM1314771.1 DMT family transporter [Sulfitobacter mediterraneus]MBM1323131.1 DMT family transporter [Sulfitobacter mediterraneus]MBM1327043.1 DMT family transporter [Sulfitobacter mediterraneus]
MVTEVPQRPLTGILWMLVTGLLFIAVTALVKYMGPRLPAAESAFLRYAIGLVFLLPALGALRQTNLSRRQWSLFGLRGFCHALGVILWFYAMTRIPIAEVTAMNYLAPIYVTLGAAVFLGEKLAARRIAAVCLGLMGAAIILRPGFREVSLGHLAMLFAAVVFAGSYLLAKVMADEVRPAVVVAMLSIFVTLALAPFALPVWVTPTLREVLLLTAVAVFATAGHYTMTLAFAAAPVTVTQPITFLQLLWATSLGVLAFNEPVDIWVIVGGFVILGSVTFITWREAMLKRQITPNANATKL